MRCRPAWSTRRNSRTSTTSVPSSVARNDRPGGRRPSTDAMPTPAQLATGLDALDDFVRLRLRQAVAELRTRQDQIDAALARPDAAPELVTAPSVRPPDPDSL